MSNNRKKSSNEKDTVSDPIRGAIAAYRGALWTCGGLSLAINILMLSSPLFMLQIYDRVLISGSMPTLLALTGLILGLFVLAACLEMVRMRLLNRVSAGLVEDMAEPTFQAILRSELSGLPLAGNQPLRDLESLSQFMTGSGPTALFDLPWMPIYIGLAFLLHPTIGVLTVVAALILLALALLNERLSSAATKARSNSSLAAHAITENVRSGSEAIWAMGIDKALGTRWLNSVTASQQHQMRAVDISSTLQSTSRFLRLFLQSACLALGAGLAIQGDLSAGAIIAASIILSRALAPVEQITGQWNNFQSFLRAWKRLSSTLATLQPIQDRTKLPLLQGALSVEGISVTPPGGIQPTLENITFRLQPGECLGIVGPSGSGKSSLLRALTGVWPLTRGEIRLDGAELSHWPRDQICPTIGYLPQDVELLTGTVHENIARFQAGTDDAVIHAAKQADVHDLILHLSDGYQTVLGPAGHQLSSGQKQRVALARALFGRPKFLVLDEPNSNLDSKGELSLSKALSRARAEGITTIIATHRPQILKIVDKILALENGRMSAFGPPAESIRASTAPSAPSTAAPVPLHASPSNLPPQTAATQ